MSTTTLLPPYRKVLVMEGRLDGKKYWGPHLLQLRYFTLQSLQKVWPSEHITKVTLRASKALIVWFF